MQNALLLASVCFMQRHSYNYFVERSMYVNYRYFSILW